MRRPLSGRDRMRLLVRARRICEQVVIVGGMGASRALKASKSATSNQESYSSRSNYKRPSNPILNSSISRLTILGADSLIGPRLWLCTPK